jgi:hypothetical protein
MSTANQIANTASHIPAAPPTNTVHQTVDVHQAIENAAEAAMMEPLGGYEMVRKTILAIPNANEEFCIDIIEIQLYANGKEKKYLRGHLHVSTFAEANPSTAFRELCKGKTVELVISTKEA